MLEEITAKGIQPGDPVGDLQDPALAAEAAALAGASNKDANKQDQGGSRLGMYRAGGSTTIFGGSGWGPYSEGPLNAVKKSMLNREGVSEENWMYMAAQRTLEVGEEWRTLRQAVLKASGGGGKVDYHPEGESEFVVQKRAAEEDMDGDVSNSEMKRRRVADTHPVGVYDPQTGLVFCE